jgi:hypothetical protein
MKTEEIASMWATDSEINPNKLVEESTKVPKLHSKYYHILNEERLRLINLTNLHDELSVALDGFFNKTLTVDEMERWQLPPMDAKKYLKADVARMVEVHPRMIEVKTKIGIQNGKIKYLEDIIKMIHNMNFTIKNCIDMKKFNAGSF